MQYQITLQLCLIFLFFNDTATTEIYTPFPTRRSSDLSPSMLNPLLASQLRQPPGQRVQVSAMSPPPLTQAPTLAWSILGRSRKTPHTKMSAFWPPRTQSLGQPENLHLTLCGKRGYWMSSRNR